MESAVLQSELERVDSPKPAKRVMVALAYNDRVSVQIVV